MNYAGDLLPQQCWDILDKEGKGAVLVDVRTRAEWNFVGMPTPTDTMHPVVGQEWQVFPTMEVDADFAATLQGTLEGMGVDKSAPICFLCRSGVRSKAAAIAMTAAGYTGAYNITGGFEGDTNGDGHRGAVNGWKASGLPWQQK